MRVLKKAKHEIPIIYNIYYRSFDETETKESLRITTSKMVIITFFLLNQYNFYTVNFSTYRISNTL